MKNIIKIIFALFLFPISNVQSNQVDVESYRIVQPNEEVKLDLKSIISRGDKIRYEIIIDSRKIKGRSPKAAAFRIVAFASDCEKSEIVLTSVSLFDNQGRRIKTMIVPPGGSDYYEPKEGTDDYNFMQKACEK